MKSPATLALLVLLCASTWARNTLLFTNDSGRCEQPVDFSKAKFDGVAQSDLATKTGVAASLAAYPTRSEVADSIGVAVAGAASDTAKLDKAANLSDVPDKAAARGNLGLGTAATKADTEFATPAQGTLAEGALQLSKLVAGVNVTITTADDSTRIDAAGGGSGDMSVTDTAVKEALGYVPADTSSVALKLDASKMPTPAPGNTGRLVEIRYDANMPSGGETNHWMMETTYADAVGGATLSDVNSVSFPSDATFPLGERTVANFNGSQCFNVSDASFPSGNSDFTLAVWLRPDATNTHGMPLMYGKLGEGLSISGMNVDDRRVAVSYYFASGSVLFSEPVTLGEWHLVVVSRSSNILSLYVDDVFQGSMAWSYSINKSGTSCFGSLVSRDWSLYGWTGRMSDMRIYSRAVTASEREKLFTAVPTADYVASETIPLEPGNNLADLTDSAAARDNLGVTAALDTKLTIPDLDGAVSGSCLAVGMASSGAISDSGLSRWTMEDSLADSFGSRTMTNHTMTFATSSTFPLGPRYVATNGGALTGASFSSAGLPFGTSPRTIMIWVKTTEKASSPCFFSYGGDGNNGALIGLYVTSAGYAAITWHALITVSSVVISDGEWHHVAASYSGSQAILYVDGVAAANASVSYSTVASSDGLGHVGSYLGGSYGCPGSFTDARIYSRVLSATEIAEIHAGTENLEASVLASATPPALVGNNLSDLADTQEAMDNLGVTAAIAAAAGPALPTMTASDTGRPIVCVGGGFPPVTPGPVSKWTLANTLADASGGRALTNSGVTFTLDSSFPLGERYVGVFNGSSYASFSAAGLPAASSAPRSFSAWVKTTSAAEGMIMAYGQSDTYDHAFCPYLLSSGYFAMSAHGPAQSVITASTKAANDDAWHNVAITYDGITATLYVDAVAVAARDVVWDTATTVGYIGQYVAGGVRWTGSLADIRMYDRALTATEVANIHGGENGSGPYAGLGPLALARWMNLGDLPDAAAARTNLGLGTAATTAATDYATAAQGSLAATALQPANIETDSTCPSSDTKSPSVTAMKEYVAANAGSGGSADPPYVVTFTSSDLVDSILTVNHNLDDTGCPTVTIKDGTGAKFGETSGVVYVSANQLTIDFSGMVVAGTCTVSVARGGGGAGSTYLPSGGTAGQVLAIGASSTAEWTNVGQWRLVEKWEPTSGTDTQHTFASLDGDVDRSYQIRAVIVAGGSGSGEYGAKINTSTSYLLQAMEGTGSSTPTSSVGTSFSLAYFSADTIYAKTLVDLEAKTGAYRMWTADAVTLKSSSVYFVGKYGGAWTDTSTNITSLTVVAPSGRTFASGTRIALYKLAQ